MKKVLTLIAAVALFATAAMAETITLTGHKASKIQDQTQGMVQYDLNAGGIDFYFTFTVVDVTPGQTYTYADMVPDYTFAEDGTTGSYFEFTAATFTKIDEDNYIASATADDGNTYNITIAPLVPITEPTRVENVAINDKATARLVDAVAEANIFQFSGKSADGVYEVYMAMQNVTSVVGTYTEGDLYLDYTALYVNDNLVDLNNILGNIVVTENDGVYTANMHYVGTDSVEYNVTFTYADPVAATTKTFNATDLEVYPNANFDFYLMFYNVYVYDFFATNDGEILYGSTYNEIDDSYEGAWEYDGGYTLDFSIYDEATQKLKYEVFSGNINLATNGTNVTLTGNALVYGDVEYNFNCTGEYVSDVENVETSKYAVLSEKNGVLVCGAEGEIVALYDMAGRMIRSIKANSDNVRIDVAIPGVYVIKINGEAIRAIVK